MVARLLLAAVALVGSTIAVPLEQPSDAQAQDVIRALVLPPPIGGSGSVLSSKKLSPDGPEKPIDLKETADRVDMKPCVLCSFVPTAQGIGGVAGHAGCPQDKDAAQQKQVRVFSIFSIPPPRNSSRRFRFSAMQTWRNS